MWKSEKNYFGAYSEGYIATRCGVVKVKIYAISLLCNITQIWQLLSVSMRNMIHLAVIWVKTQGLHKKNLLWSNTEDYTVNRNRVIEQLQG